MYPPLTTIDQPGDQARRDPADSIQRQECRCACGDATTGPSDLAGAGDQARRDPADSIHRQCFDVRVLMQRQVPRVQTVLKTVEAPPAQFVGRVWRHL